MRKILCISVLVSLLLSVSACGNASDHSGDSGSETNIGTLTTAGVQESVTETETSAEAFNASSYTAQKPANPVTLTNHMTDFERACVTKRPFSLLDDTAPAPDVKIETVNVTKEAQTALYQSMAERGQLSEEELQQWIAEAGAYSYQAALINGVFYDYYIPPEGYDGGRIKFENGVSFEDMEAFLADVEAGYCKNCGMSDSFRDSLFIKEREKLLHFITDDLMPYLGEQYHIDYPDSTLMGHSMGGVFSHYACFMSDNYENQLFFRYIVGSPAFFNLYGTDTDYDAARAESNYGYFERHDALDKKLFLFGGLLEDPDYSGTYHGHDSLLTGLQKLHDRLSPQKADCTYKLYESHHYQYVPDMLLEFLKTEYPV